MDREKLKETCLDFIRKYRYALLFLLMGIFLLIVPVRNTTPGQNTQSEETTSVLTRDLQTELEALLCRMEGAGKVKVLLTQACGEEVIYQIDEQTRTDTDTKDIQRDTVVITNSDRAQSGLIQRIDPPVYLGAVVLSQGADSAAVRLALVEAVKSATGLPANKITVLKMK